MTCIFSIDVEDWFHILDLPSTPELSQWEGLPSRVEKNFLKLLDLLDEGGAQATCFFLGWVADKFPGLLREAARRGHEIASHSYSHRLVYQMSPQDFYDDAVRSKKTLEDIGGRAVLGYRASGFSVTEKTPWFFDKLVEAGYRYDSSVFPAPRGHGGMQDGCLSPYRVDSSLGRLIEFPVSVERILGRPVCFFGGGYLRVFPYWIIRNMTNQVLRRGRPVIFYVHPREIDPNHPRLPMTSARRFKSYVNLRTTEQKIRHLISEYPMSSFESFLTKNRDWFGDSQKSKTAPLSSVAAENDLRPNLGGRP
ncbi:MAG TPA: XrtA system polysaccharide deacetylase [Candidatus Acidoferrales bacterium]|nr:XrtA system polysaccharide deacetylase [Candidatus Acidoferrales bacterium]